MSFPEGLPEKRGKLGHIREDVLQPGKAYDAEKLAGGPGASGEEPAIRQGGKDASATGQVVAQRGRFGLRSKSEMLYPEAYRPVDPVFWQGLSSDQQFEVMRLQAVAQEKVGFERGTQKYFIDTSELEPSREVGTGVDLVSLATPRLVLGGMLIGSGLLLAALGLSSVIGDPGWAALGGGAVLAGGLTIAYGNN